MKKVCLWCAILVLMSNASLLSQSTNVLDRFNGGFELGLDANWRFFEVPSPLGSTAVITTDAAAGTKAVKVTFVPAVASLVDRALDNWETNVPVSGGADYTLTLQAKTSAGSPALRLRATFGFFSSDRVVLEEGSQEFPLTAAYQTCSLTRSAPAGAVYCFIAFRLMDATGPKAAGTFFLDDVRLVTNDVLPSVCAPRLMPVTLPSEDVPIASINVTEAPYNAKNDGSADASGAFQQALNFAAANGGAVVFVPAGKYRFDQSIVVPEKVTLRGEWQDPDHGGLGLGTILQVYGGKGSEIGDAFLSLNRGSGVRNLTIFYPEQTASPVAYPWTIQCNPETSTGDNTSIVNVTLINSYLGIRVGPSANELHYIRNVFGMPLKNGIWLSETTDIGRIINVHFDPKYWSTSGLAGAPSSSAIKSFTQAQGEGISMGRSDWEYISNVSLTGYKTGLRIFRYLTTGPAANGVIYDLTVREAQTGLLLEDANAFGFAVTRSTFDVQGAGAACISAAATFKTVVQFNTCRFEGSPKNSILFNDASTGRMTFQNCTFASWGQTTGDAAVKCEKGSVAVLGSAFLADKTHLYAGAGAASVLMIDNRYPVRANIVNNSSGEIIVSNEKLNFPRLDSTLAHPFGVERKPSGTGVFVVTDYGAVSSLTADNTAAFVQALAAAQAAGGGTVYVPGGWWKISTHLTIPSGVELRGIWDVPHHTISQGSVLLAYEKNSTEPFIALSARSGIRGLTIWYPEQNFTSYPWAIQGRGADCWIKDVVAANAYQIADMATYPTPNHYISYLAGCPLRTGVFVNNTTGEGWVENVQFNSHYWVRSNGYPKSSTPDPTVLQSYLQNNSDALRFGACMNEHIFGNFVYAAKRGLYFSSEGACKATVFLHGSDASAYGAVIESPAGSNIDLINTQLVVAGASKLAYIQTPSAFAGKAVFYNTLAWGDPSTQTAEIRGTGSVTLQQLNTQADAVNILGGTARLHGLTFGRSFATQVAVGSGAGASDVYGNYDAAGIGIADAGTVKARADYNYTKKAMQTRFQTGWEAGETQPSWISTSYEIVNAAAAAGESALKCAVEQFNGANVLSLKVKDNSAADSRIYFKISTVKVPVFASTALKWKLYPKNELGRSVHADLLFTDGTRLTECAPVCDDSTSITAAHGTVGQWTSVSVKLPASAAGKSIQTVMIGYNRASDTGDIDAFVDDLSVVSQSALPDGWTSGDIGGVPVQGLAVADGAKFFVSGVGKGMMYPDDGFYFPAKEMTGDCTFTACITKMDALQQDNAMLGVMIREKRAANSKFAAVSLYPMRGVQSVLRTDETALLQITAHTALSRALPMWLRIVRKGNVFSTYTSANGIQWTGPLVQQTCAMTPSVLAGIALGAGTGSEAVMNAQLDNVSVSADAWSTGVSSSGGSVPTEWALGQNYPNPFNPSTVIRYDVPTKEYFRLSIYDLLGREIAVLAEGLHEPGSYTAQWDASGSASGMYICHLHTSASTFSKKMLLVR